MSLDEEYNPAEIENIRQSSTIINDCGFTLISNGRTPFFSIFPSPNCGFSETIGNGEEARKIFKRLSSSETIRALIYIYKKTPSYVFAAGVLSNARDIDGEDVDRVLDNVASLRIINKKELSINGKNRVLYVSRPSHTLFSLFLVAHELNYAGSYSLHANQRNKTLLT